MNAGELLANTARSYPDQVAWIWDDRTRTYRETDERADAFAQVRGFDPDIGNRPRTD